MSASLVGSEMCIRDSPGLPRANAEALRGLRIGGLRIGVRRSALSRLTDCLLYTSDAADDM
eukprot:9971443-Alexandrium_andersonii.AAC.1